MTPWFVSILTKTFGPTGVAVRLLMRIDEVRSPTWAAGFWASATGSGMNARPTASTPAEVNILRRVNGI